MIKVYAGIASVGFLVLGGAAGCSSASTPDDGDGGTSTMSNNTAGTNTSSAGTNTQSQGGSGSNTAGTGSDAGTSSTPTAGTSSGAGAPAVGAMCKSIKTGMACTPEGTDCPALPCGLADSGTRACMCQATWMCSSCDFSASPFKDKPAEVTTCTTEADKLECTVKGAVCEGAPGGEVCACWTDDEGALIWDCDKPPTSWAAM